MRKSGADPKVKKTLLRNYEHKVRTQPKTIYDSDAGPSKLKKATQNNNNIVCELDEPTLCSSESLADYLEDIKKTIPPKVSSKDIIEEKPESSSKLTKKLNFHFNDRIYKNLVDLNTDVAKSKSKDKRPVKNSIKRDLEPNIEDFCQDEKESDMCPHIPDVKRKIKPIQRIEDGQLHKLIASFEIL